MTRAPDASAPTSGVGVKRTYFHAWINGTGDGILDFVLGKHSTSGAKFSALRSQGSSSCFFLPNILLAWEHELDGC